MIVESNDALGGRSTIITSNIFICKVNTAKKGLIFGGLRTIIYDMSHYGTYARMPSESDAIALIEYHDYDNNAKRLHAHDAICKHIDKEFDDGKSIIDAVACTCYMFDDDKHIKGFIRKWLR